MPRIQYYIEQPDTATPDTDAAWHDFCRAIDSDSDPRESKRPVQDDEWCDEDDYETDR